MIVSIHITTIQHSSQRLQLVFAVAELTINLFDTLSHLDFWIDATGNAKKKINIFVNRLAINLVIHTSKPYIIQME